MADDPVELARSGNVLLGEVPLDMRDDWVADKADGLDMNKGESVAEFIGRWWKYEIVLNPLREVDKRAADIPPRDWVNAP